MSMSINRMKTTPIPVKRTTRVHDIRVLTSLPAGKMVPLAAIPLLREDSVSRCNVAMSFEMMETVEMLMNAVNVNVKAYLVPHLAFERFRGMDDLNRAYEGVSVDGVAPVVPYIETMAAPAHGENDILLYMGKHARSGTNINSAYVEAYNEIWNFRARNRSPDISSRDRLDGTLAPAFWLHSNFAHIVPDFDQAIIDGEVPLNVVEDRLQIRGLGLRNDSVTTPATTTIRESDFTLSDSAPTYQAGNTDKFAMRVKTDNGQVWPDIFAELAQDGITVSLSNIEMARRTQAFAALRRQYNGHTDDYIIDLLMDGISVPEQSWKQPMLIGEKSTVFGMAKRYASDGGNLTQSVVNGAAMLNLSFSVPRVPTGGVIMLIAEITPDQLFERQRDPYLHATSVSVLPQFLRDTLDPEKVSVVPNEFVDLDHDNPSDTFGYAPLNYEWATTAPQIGGRFYRPEVDAAFDEDRQRIWAVETQNPVLSEDFYLCTTMHTKPFVVTNQDPFEAVVRGSASIVGNTVFGGALIEATDDYAKVLENAPQERIAKTSA